MNKTACSLCAFFQPNQAKRLMCQLMPVFVDTADLTLLWGRVQPVCKQPVKLCGLYYIVLSFPYRVLYGNKITELPKGLFDGLVSLQLL